MQYEEIFNPDTLNIFVDASIHKYKSNGYIETIGCPGLVAVATDYMTGHDVIDVDSMILRHATNNSSEIMAIWMGVQYALSQRNRYKTINIFSDSKICVYGLREWIFNWYSGNQDYILYGSSGVVSNQETFKEIVRVIASNNLKINLYHQKGHVSLNNQSSLDNARRVFGVSNNINIDDNRFMYTLSYYNDQVDVNTKYHIKSFLSMMEETNPLQNPFIIGLQTNEMSRYKTCINIGGK